MNHEVLKGWIQSLLSSSLCSENPFKYKPTVKSGISQGETFGECVMKYEFCDEHRPMPMLTSNTTRC